jgi:hypothetical protein
MVSGKIPRRHSSYEFIMVSPIAEVKKLSPLQKAPQNNYNEV